MNQEIKQRFTAWWNCDKTDRPLIRLISKKNNYDSSKLINLNQYVKSDYDIHLNPNYRTGLVRNQLVTHNFHAEAFPYADINLGPGSMASYLISEPGFSADTVWYNEACVDGISGLINIGYDKSTHWWQDHLNAVEKAVKLSAGDFYIGIPDIQENLDILSAIRGAQNLCYDLIDEPETVRKIQSIIDRDFYKYFEIMYNAVKDKNGDCAYTAFSIWGKGKTSKIQCDFSALISCEIYDSFVLPSLKKQCDYFDNTLYHLDGKDAIRHLKSILSLKNLDALQWTPGAGQNDGGSEQWFNIYDAVKDAGKALWISIYDGTPDEWIFKAKRIVKRYGADGIYFLFDETDEQSADKILLELTK